MKQGDCFGTKRLAMTIFSKHITTELTCSLTFSVALDILSVELTKNSHNRRSGQCPR